MIPAATLPVTELVDSEQAGGGRGVQHGKD
jgi:hypothetical protein